MGRHMKLVSFNIQYGNGADATYDLSRTIAVLRDQDADIIFLQEVERHWQRDNFDDQSSLIAEAFPEYFSNFSPHYDMDASHFDSDGKKIERRRQHGTMILSRVPLISLRTFPLPVTKVFAPQHSVQRGLQEALICWQGRYIRIYNTHLSHLCSEFRIPQIKFILKTINTAAKTGMAWTGGHPSDASWLSGGEPPVPEDVILCGDLNLTPTSLEYDLLCGPLSPVYGRITTQENLLDSWVLAGHDETSGVSCPSFGRIDYCFLSPSMAGTVINCEIDEHNKASDHYPLIVEFDMNLSDISD